MNRAVARCEIKRDKGIYHPTSNCHSNFVVVDSTIPVSFAKYVQKQRDKLTAAINSRCTDQVFTAGFDVPCADLNGVSTAEGLARCVIFDGHGASAARLQFVVYTGSRGPGRNRCYDSFSRNTTAYATAYLNFYRTCAKALAAGRSCDQTKLLDLIARSREKNTARIVKDCGTTTVLLGGACNTAGVPYPTVTDAVTCAFDFSDSEMLNVLKMNYDLPFLSE
jgi:hypothetical protein